MNRSRTLLLLISVLVGIFVESAWNAPDRWLGAHLSLVPPLIVYTALRTEAATLALVATLGGLWLDSLSTNPFGISILPLFWVGFALQHWQDLILRDLPFAQLVLGAAAGMAIPILTLLLVFSLGETPIIGWGSLWQLAVGGVAGGLLTPLCFRVLDKADRMFAYPPTPSVSFRPDREIKRGRY